MRYRLFLLTVLLLTVTAGGTKAQTPNWATWGSHHRSLETSCGEYQWPEEVAPCPEVQIKQKHEKQSNYRHIYWNNDPNFPWDTVIDCQNPQIILSCMPYVPVQYFNGFYAVDTIDYNPADPTFHQGTLLNITSDDIFCSSATSLPSDCFFYFFGRRKQSFVVGSNGMLTFNANAVNQTCSYSYTANLPWTPSTSGVPGNVNIMRDAIYGIYEDTHPLSSYCNNYGAPNYQGIWYGVQDEYPCRKIICSWNDVPQYNGSANDGTGSNPNNRCSYQIVCYEGSNIIEVHVKQRRLTATSGWWAENHGIIGIQNATGNPVTKSNDVNSPDRWIPEGVSAPAAFWPSGGNQVYTALDTISFRFTPQGSTQKNAYWYRILDNGDTVHLSKYDAAHPNATEDTNGYYKPMGHRSSCPTLSLAYVSPKRPSRYVFYMYFKDANNNTYNLSDTIVVGCDTAAYVTVRAIDSTADVTNLNICEGTRGDLVFEYPLTQIADTISYNVFRRSNGETIELPVADCLDLGTPTDGTTMRSQTIRLRPGLPQQGVRPNKIDSIYVQITANFTSHCGNFDTMLVSSFPNFDLTDTVGICKDSSFTWSANGRTYRNSVYATENLHSTPGCDSTVHLKLTVYDKSYTIDTVYDCKPYTWSANNVTYYESNTATAANDVIRLTNDWGCDSTVQLQFTMLPVKARISTNREFFDFDHLDAVLTDVSVNNDSRIWTLPGGGTLSGPVAYYTIPAELDMADIWLKAYSPYGCVDSTNIVIPLRKESFWMPNAFTPGSANGNNLFGSISTRTLTEEMYIYNRNGMLVFHCDSPDCKWDGRDLNGRECPQGVYTYLVRYTNEFLPKVTKVLRGTVTLIR